MKSLEIVSIRAFSLSCLLSFFGCLNHVVLSERNIFASLSDPLQITSRSKIVSSIRNSNIVSTDDDSSVRENDISLLGLEVALISDVGNKNGTVPSLEEDNGSIFSSDQGTLTSSETPVSQPVTISRDFDKDVALLGEKSKFLSLGTPSPARYQPEMKDATSPYSDKNDIVPPFLSSVSEIVSPDSDKNDIVPSSLSSVSEISSSTLDKNDIVLSSLSSISETSISKDEKQEDDSEEATMQLDADNEDSDSTIEDAKPPPLAAANVMNVLLVAAECAPWIKTGLCFELLIL